MLLYDLKNTGNKNCGYVIRDKIPPPYKQPKQSKQSPMRIGQRYELVARKYLEQRGLIHIESNYRTPFGEIDLIMKDGGFLVFVEVRYRRDNRFGGAIHSLSNGKSRRIVLAAEQYMLINQYDGNARFDFVSIQGNAEPLWLRNVLQDIN